MYAVIETGGKQYRVQKGDVIDVERSLGAAEGDEVTFDQVLLVSGDGVKAGEDAAGATVSGTVVGEVRGPKVIVFKKKRRKGYKRRNGHRQDLLRVRIEAIEA
ncbi:MAG: 50S ribosomal protein L21 [Thermoanaerobaculia bacterium]